MPEVHFYSMIGIVTDINKCNLSPSANKKQLEIANLSNFTI